LKQKPTRTREYHGAVFDSTYWDRFTPRDGDIVISTSIKAGTTWMQRICAALVFQKAELDTPMDALSPWLDMRVALPEFTIPLLEGQTHRRFIKSHLPVDAIPFFDNVYYIVVCRDARDVFMSMVNHWRNMVQRLFDEVNTHDGAELLAYRDREGIETSDQERAAWMRVRRWEGETAPKLDDVDIREAWRQWATRSMYPWEHDGYPAWSHFYHLASWWPYRKLPNILLVHYADLLADLDGQMRKISEWLQIPIDESVWPSLVEAATFSRMKTDFQKTTPVVTQGIWKDPAKFFNKGASNQWRDVLSDEDLELYDAAANRSLDPDARRWMEEGSLAFADPKQI
jgi:aryl sulfotransferase